MIFVEAGALCNVYEDLSLGGAFTAYCCGYKIHDPSGKNVKVMSKLTPDFCPVASYPESSRAQIENSSCHGHVAVHVEMITILYVHAQNNRFLYS